VPIQQVATDNLYGPPNAASEKFRPAHQTAHQMPSLFQGLEQAPTHVSGRSGQQDLRLRAYATQWLEHSHLSSGFSGTTAASSASVLARYVMALEQD
jgi:hypothetical protein